MKLTIKHLALRAQTITLGYQLINFLPSLQNTLDSLMQHDLGLIQLLLNLHDTVRLLGVLIFCNIIIEWWEGDSWVRGSPFRLRVGADELIDNLRKKLMCDKGWVFMIGDYYAANTFASSICVKCVG
ncbi:hypothetical protein ACMFMF_001547 [Clarireedia jacksonii]